MWLIDGKRWGFIQRKKLHEWTQSETHLLLHTHHAHRTYGLVVAKHVLGIR